MRTLRFLAGAALLYAACAPGQTAAEAPAPTIPPPTNTPIAAAPATTTDAPSPATETPATPSPATETPRPAATTPRPAGPFRTLPVGAALPSDAQCAARVLRDPFEPRPENRSANLTNVYASGFRLQGSYLAKIAPGYQERVTGNFTGTTDEILRWGACKWGFDEDDVRAQAVVESYWRQALLSDCGVTAQPGANGCASMGILSVKGADIPATHPGTWPAAHQSTAFNVDYALAVRRLCFDGKETWQRDFNPTYAAGDLWGCIGRWFSGRWHDANAEQYIARVRATMTARTWLSPAF